MNMYRRVVFWEPCVSPHKWALFDALAAKLDGITEIVCVAHQDVPAERRALGWGDVSLTRFQTIIAPAIDVMDNLIARDVDHSLHVFAGVRWHSTIVLALKKVKRAGCALAILSEPRDSAGLKGRLRFVQSWVTEGWLRRRAACVLAIGRHGPGWFRRVGYPSERIFPFAYFLEDAKATRSECIDDARKPRLGYVGRLIEQKGLQYLFDAALKLKDRATLVVVGDGELRPQLEAFARRHHMDVRFAGVLPMADVQRVMADLDVVVLPSITREDGWGAVVSEALLAGAAVVASECVGASILLDFPGNGRVVPAGEGDAIVEAIASLREGDALRLESRQRRTAWARDRLTAQAGATYLESILKFTLGSVSRPEPYYV
jgi:glycosyltransferase involved in cell wall biosynthesis